MTRDEFKLKVTNLISSAQHWQMCSDDEYWSDYKEETAAHGKDILSEFDRFTEEVENLEAEVYFEANQGELLLTDLRLAKKKIEKLENYICDKFSEDIVFSIDDTILIDTSKNIL